MAKKKLDYKFWTNTIISIILLGIIVAILIGFRVGWFDNILNINVPTLDGDLQDRFENPSIDSECALFIRPETIEYGDSTTGTIKDGLNTYCEVWGWMEGDGVWQKLWEGTTNSDGAATYNDDWFIEGTFHLRAICDLNGNGILDTTDCVTNEETLIVNPVEVVGDCTDSDGLDIDTPGHVTLDGISYYDKCLDVGAAVTEYTCVDGMVHSEDWMCDYGQECFSTRSGGYCRDIIPTYSPGDIVWSNSGSGGITGGTLPVTNIDLGDLNLETGTCRLGVRFNTDWDWVPNGQACYSVQGYDHPIWDIYDSLGLEYHRVDTNPIPLNRDLHPESYIWNWDGETDWRVKISKGFNVPDCNIDYTWSLQVYIYDC